ncbi:unnamed protein product, partial [Staurois parvus]
MRCPWYLFHSCFFEFGQGHGPHDPLLPGGPMSCQSSPGCQSVMPVNAHQCSLSVPITAASLAH